VFFGNLSNSKNGKKGFPLNFREIEKGLVLIYQLLNIESLNEFAFLYFNKNPSSFKLLHKEFWVKQRKEILCFLKTFDNKLSNIRIRTLSEFLENPSTPSGTCFLDGHDTHINYHSVKAVSEYKQTDFINYKFKFKPGIRTQVLIDTNRICMAISESLPCKKNVDGKMWQKMKLENFLEPGDDILYIDGGYTLFVEEL
jgi:hypothetical protein